MGDPGGPTADGLVERIRALTPTIAATSFEAEAQRRPLDEVIDALKATGVFRSFVPKRYGGYEIDMATYVDIGLAVAEADPSMGWITTFYMEHNWLLTMFSEELQDEIFGARGVVPRLDQSAVPVKKERSLHRLVSFRYSAEPGSTQRSR